MHTTRRARDMIGRELVEFADTQVPGLSIRVRQTAATWCLRGRLGPRQTIFTIGPAGDGNSGISLTAAREWAIEAKKMLKNGIRPGGWLKEQATGHPVERTFDPNIDGPTWGKAREIFLDFVRQHRAPATFQDYRITLRSPDLQPWEDRLLKSITQRDVQALQEAIFKRGYIAQAHHVLRIVKSCMAWLSRNSESAITVSAAKDVKPIDAGKLARAGAGYKLGRVRTPDELGRLGWRLAAYSGPPSARLASALAMLTVQRITTVLTARKAHFERMLDGGMWHIPAELIKGKEEHLIPLPPTAWKVAQLAVLLSPPSNPLLFPQARRRQAGDEMDGHLSYRAVRNAMGSGVSPHDFRRSFATHGRARLGFGVSDIKGILDHAEGKSGDVTLERYDLGDGRHWKWKVMTAWENWLLEQIAAQAPHVDSSIPAFLTADNPHGGNGEMPR